MSEDTSRFPAIITFCLSGPPITIDPPIFASLFAYTLPELLILTDPRLNLPASAADS